MKKLLIGLLALGSFSTFASDTCIASLKLSYTNHNLHTALPDTFNYKCSSGDSLINETDLLKATLNINDPIQIKLNVITLFEKYDFSVKGQNMFKWDKLNGHDRYMNELIFVKP